MQWGAVWNNHRSPLSPFAPHQDLFCPDLRVKSLRTVCDTITSPEGSCFGFETFECNDSYIATKGIHAP